MSLKMCLLLVLMLLVVVHAQVIVTQGVNQLEYAIELRTDGSAFWTIEQRGIDITESFETFHQNASSLVKTAQTMTQRNMTATDFSMNVNVSGDFKIVEYRFRWDGFGETKDSKINIGDVFGFENFFNYLYGDGIIYLKYPGSYAVSSVSPAPNEQNSTTQTLEWYGIEELKLGEPKVVLEQKSEGSSVSNTIGNDLILIVSLLAIAGGGIFGIYYFAVARRKKRVLEKKGLDVRETLVAEESEDMVISLLRSAGGSLYQSTITERCGFSRAKTSKLLKKMEHEGRIKREDKGRERVVTLLKQKEG